MDSPLLLLPFNSDERGGPNSPSSSSPRNSGPFSPNSSPSPSYLRSSPALEHVVSLTTRNQWVWWSLSAAFAIVGLLCTELHTWELLTTRTVTGCALGSNLTIPANATLSSCADAGLFDCRTSPTLTTQAPASWVSGLFLMLLAVVCFWGFVAYILSAQNWRASCLLPFHVVVQAKSFNGSFYTLALIATAAYFFIKFSTFSAQPNSVSVPCTKGPITVRLLPVFSGEASGAGGGQWGTMGASFATFWLSFAAMSTLISRYAADSYADITLSTLLTCEAPGKGPCDSHDGTPSPVQLALQQPFVILTAQDLDRLLKLWYEARGLQGKGHKWQDARWLMKLGANKADLVADAAAWVRGSCSSKGSTIQ